MQIFLNIILFLLILGIIVIIHELGHFLVAKRVGVFCYEYSIGMGPALYQKEGKETIFSIRTIPIGGYVSMAGEEGIEDIPFKIGDVIGLNLDKDNNVNEIVLSPKLDSYIKFEVMDYNLQKGKYNNFYLRGKILNVSKSKLLPQKDYNKRVIIENELTENELKLQGSIKTFSLSEKAKYVYKQRQKQRIVSYERTLDRKSLWRKILVVAAGPIMNFVLALLIFWFAFLIAGKPTNKPIIGDVSKDSLVYNKLLKDDTIKKINGYDIDNWNDINSSLNKEIKPETKITYIRKNEEKEIQIPTFYYFNILGFQAKSNSKKLIVNKAYGYAQKAGLKSNDEIIEIDSKKIETWEELITLSNNLNQETIKLSILRDGKKQSLEYKTFNSDQFKKLSGVSPFEIKLGVIPKRGYKFGYAIKESVFEIGRSVKKVFATIAALFTPKSSVGVKDLAGPVGIFSIVGQIRKQGFMALLIFMGFLSINIGLLNLMPIPALDGGRIFFYLIGESYIQIKKQFIKIKMKKEGKLNSGEDINIDSRKLKKIGQTINLIFFLLLISLIVFITIMDIKRL